MKDTLNYCITVKGNCLNELRQNQFPGSSVIQSARQAHIVNFNEVEAKRRYPLETIARTVNKRGWYASDE